MLAALVASGWLLRITVLAPDPLVVSTVAVERGRVESTVTNSTAGTLESRRRSRLSAEIGSRVTAILHREGDQVEAGEPLIRLNDASFVAQVELAQAALEVTQARNREACLARDLARRNLARNRELAQNNVVSEDLLDNLEVKSHTAAASCTALAAEVKRAEATLRAAEAERAKTVIRAPFPGVVAEVRTEVGEWITPSPPLLTAPAVIDLIDTSSLYVSAPMDEVDSGRIRIGQAAKVTVDSHAGRLFEGRVVRVAPYVLDRELQNRTVEVEVEFDAGLGGGSDGGGNKGGFLAGTSADVELIVEARERVLRIPTAALLEGGRVLVFEDGLLAERELEIGLRNWDFVEVSSGLSAGELVVVSLDRKEVVAGKKARLADEGGTGAAR
ncbi:MAG: efflux RND transporter periplasmic adaptor subunit [Deltaproteobacteria bacterium]|nr:efflux RND transporter periplasmic adaptor subunit [Deltaproteobacteria bacterium]MBW2419145.1 efflux RND transporter periplasmic adaptor subunit [Deltaproteobacteria bacterium]